MNKLLIAAFFLSFQSGFCVDHSKENDFMLLSLPKSGSGFLLSSVKESNTWLLCRDDYFNFVANELPKLTVNQQKSLFAHCISELTLKEAYENRWKRQRTQCTREQWLAFQVPFFQKHFTIFVIYRHRKYTFPTTHQLIYNVWYNSFLSAQFYPNSVFAKIQDYLNSKALTEAERRCALHDIAFYTILSDCVRYGLPVIDYEKIMTCSGSDLYGYLESRIPPKIFNEQLVHFIEEKRFNNPKGFLKRRAAAYENLKTEPFCQTLITFMKSLDPSFQYWYLFE